jgi:hypothetical protein
MHVSLKGMASFSICVCSPITRDPTLSNKVNKVRTHEFTLEIIAEEIQQILRMNMTSNHESTMKNTWQHNHYNKQPHNARLTQIRHQGNLTWNCAHQTIVREIQHSCRIKKNDKQAREYNEKHITQSLQQATKQHSTHPNSTSRQSD